VILEREKNLFQRKRIFSVFTFFVKKEVFFIVFVKKGKKTYFSFFRTQFRKEFCLQLNGWCVKLAFELFFFAGFHFYSSYYFIFYSTYSTPGKKIGIPRESRKNLVPRGNPKFSTYPEKKLLVPENIFFSVSERQ